MSVLDEIIRGVREDLSSRRTSLSEVLRQIDETPPAIDSLSSLRENGISIIAEVKRSSPSKGALAPIIDPAGLAQQYEEAGASVVSVLTEQRRFGGSLADLQAVRESVHLPLLRKDFMVDEYQFYESRAAGADLVLLIVAALSSSQLRDFLDITNGLGMRALVEVHTEDELERACEISPDIIGVNSRNLKDLSVSRDVFSALLPRIPDSIVKVAESGISSRSDVVFAENAGANAVLVGEALVKGTSPGTKLRELLGED